MWQTCIQKSTHTSKEELLNLKLHNQVDIKISKKLHFQTRSHVCVLLCIGSKSDPQNCQELKSVPLTSIFVQGTYAKDQVHWDTKMAWCLVQKTKIINGNHILFSSNQNKLRIITSDKHLTKHQRPSSNSEFSILTLETWPLVRLEFRMPMLYKVGVKSRASKNQFCERLWEKVFLETFSLVVPFFTGSN